MLFTFLGLICCGTSQTGTSEQAYVKDSDIDAAKIAAMKAAELGRLISMWSMNDIFFPVDTIIIKLRNAFIVIRRICIQDNVFFVRHAVFLFFFFSILIKN